MIEDDFARYMAHDDGKPLVPPLISDDPDGTVVHIRSMTKVTSPNLRVGAIAARGPVMARLRAASVIDTMLVPAPLQYTTLEVVTSPSWRRGLATLGKTLKHRRATARDAIAAAFPTELTHYPRGGYHLWVSLPRSPTAGSSPPRHSPEGWRSPRETTTSPAVAAVHISGSAMSLPRLPPIFLREYDAWNL